MHTQAQLPIPELTINAGARRRVKNQTTQLDDILLLSLLHLYATMYDLGIPIAQPTDVVKLLINEPILRL